MKKEALQLTQAWDKTFPQSAQVTHSKVTFVNRYGITLAADLYDGGGKGAIPFDRLAAFFAAHLQTA